MIETRTPLHYRKFKAKPFPLMGLRKKISCTQKTAKVTQNGMKSRIITLAVHFNFSDPTDQTT